MALMSLSWCLGAALALLCGSSWPQAHSALAPENEVPLRPTTWLPEGKITSITLPKGRTRRLYFTLKKKAPVMSVTVSPCDLPIEWTLAARTLKDKPQEPAVEECLLKDDKTLGSTKKSVPEVWWRGPGTEEKMHSFTGSVVNTYRGPSHPHASIYIVRLRSKQQNTQATVYLHEGLGPSGVFPLIPADPRVHTLGVGMTSVTLSWVPSASINSLPHKQKSYEYCVLVNSQQNYPSLCAARESMRREKEQKQENKDKRRRVTVWPILKEWWWQQWHSYPEPQSAPSSLNDEYADLQCVCQGTESVCTVSELLPDTLYYFDVYVMDRLNGTSMAYKGTYARTHEEARAVDYLAKRRGAAVESRSDTERVLCKYFQELNPRRAVTTAVIGGLEPGTAYVFDVYLMRRWGIPIKYASKMLKTRKEC
ncbi:Protein NDNF Neuron-derived neurotrophic factor Precursor [Larimichthys crocea]|uniref:Protein NDNF n=1 Tax=Larimichthys crocea TaxID=215358 RepID=A0A6G0HNZ0_LARCR|nr:Protein NDNF Neuron-derived neurotrophic factor Precursor [Larimichthys crocea]